MLGTAAAQQLYLLCHRFMNGYALQSMCNSALAGQWCRSVQDRRIYEYEMALLANLTPESADEALVLVKSLAVSSSDVAPPATAGSYQHQHQQQKNCIAEEGTMSSSSSINQHLAQ
jgi:hypothetical protein